MKSVDEYAQMDANDESLNRWKASLGITGGGDVEASGPKARNSDSVWITRCSYSKTR